MKTTNRLLKKGAGVLLLCVLLGCGSGTTRNDTGYDTTLIEPDVTIPAPVDTVFPDTTHQELGNERRSGSRDTARTPGARRTP